jgi:hypothetical protein
MRVGIGVAVLLSLKLGGCGILVPEIEEFWGTRTDAAFKVNKISSQVVCELRRAVQTVFWENEKAPVIFVQDPGAPPPPKHRDLAWFKTWGVQVSLNLIVVENISLSPGASLIKPLSSVESVSTSIGGSLSSTATRNDKLNMFFTVKELLYGTPSMNLSCLPGPANADLFIQSDLKLYDWLKAALLPYDVDIINYYNNATAQNTIQHEVKFQIVSNGNVTPTWKLVRVTANTSGTFFAAGRDRTQDLTITFGPTIAADVKPPKGTAEARRGTRTLQLATPAQNSHLAAEIGLAVSHALKGQ